jgi:hypothetical protein
MVGFTHKDRTGGICALKAQNPDEGGRLDARSSLKSLFRVYKKGLYIPVLPLKS